MEAGAVLGGSYNRCSALHHPLKNLEREFRMGLLTACVKQKLSEISDGTHLLVETALGGYVSYGADTYRTN